MEEELHKIPFIWGDRFFSLFCRKTKLLTEAIDVLQKLDMEGNGFDINDLIFCC